MIKSCPHIIIPYRESEYFRIDILIHFIHFPVSDEDVRGIGTDMDVAHEHTIPLPGNRFVVLQLSEIQIMEYKIVFCIIFQGRHGYFNKSQQGEQAFKKFRPGMYAGKVNIQ